MPKARKKVEVSELVAEGKRPTKYARFDKEGKRYYDIPEIGRALRSVTSITGLIDKPALVAWAAKISAEYFQTVLLDKLLNGEITIKALRLIDVNQIIKDAKAYHKKISKEAADKGTRVHAFVEAFIQATISGDKEIEVQVDNDIETPAKGFLRWWAENKVVPKYQERTVWSLQGGGFAGTLDGFWKVNERWCVVDIKTSAAIYDDMILQVSAYYHAFKQRFPKQSVSAASFLRLDKETGDYEWIPLTEKELALAYRKFLCLAQYVNIGERVKEKS